MRGGFFYPIISIVHQQPSDEHRDIGSLAGRLQSVPDRPESLRPLKTHEANICSRRSGDSYGFQRRQLHRRTYLGSPEAARTFPGAKEWPAIGQGKERYIRVEPMRMNDPHAPLITYSDFRAFVADKDGRYEFVDGQAVALASPSKPHGRLAFAVGTRLRDHLRVVAATCT